MNPEVTHLSTPASLVSQVVSSEMLPAKKRRAPVIAGALALLLFASGVALVSLRGARPGAQVVEGIEAHVQSIEQEVDRCLAALDWQCVIEQAGKGLALSPASSELRTKKSTAEVERKNQDIYEQFSKAEKANDDAEAVKQYLAIPQTSIYKQKAQDVWKRVKRVYLAEHIAKAGELQRAGKCEEARQLVAEVLTVDDSNAAAKEIVTSCDVSKLAPKPPRAGVGGHMAGSRVPSPSSKPEAVEASAVVPDPTVEPPPQAQPAPKPKGSCEDALVDAQDSYTHGNYQGAIDKARKCTKEEPRNPKAWRLIGGASCFLQDKPGATTAWNKLTNLERQFLIYICQRNGIALP